MEISQITSKEELVIDILKKCTQDQLIEEFNKRSQEDKDKLVEQILFLNENLSGGLENYVTKARQLLKNDIAGVDFFEDYKVDIPQGVRMEIGTQEFDEMEELGLREIAKTGFVLVAGGIGERLGFNGIKIDLPICLIENDYTYIRFYCSYIRACEQRIIRYGYYEGEESSFRIPLCIMASDETYDQTIKSLETHKYYGLDPEQVQVVKQKNVPALRDIDGNMAIDLDDFSVITKPHGHGDIHYVLYKYKIVEQWKKQGKQWLVCLFDTNALAVKSLPSMLGVSKANNWEMNTCVTPRKPGQAMGAMCKLTNIKDNNMSVVMTVEYNQIDSLLKKKWEKGGDVQNDKGNSDFPGNTSTIVFKIDEYLENIQRTQGQVPEFINPKYATADKRLFIAPTRLECLITDYPRISQFKNNIGFTEFDTWFAFSPLKNNIRDAQTLHLKGLPSMGAAENEFMFYYWSNKMLSKICGVQLEKQEESKEYGGIQIKFGPRVLVDPTFAITVAELRKKITGTVKISKNSSLVLKGIDSRLHDMTLNGHLVVEDGKEIEGEINKKQLRFVECESTDPEIYQIRGYKESLEE